jgi:hypothetical protein
MIPMQIMIGQLTGQPLPVHQIEPTRIHTFNEHGNSITFVRSEERQQADKKRSIQAIERMRENLRKHYGNRMFTRNAIKRERLFPHNKTTLPSLLNDMLESGELLLYASDNRGDVYVFADAENPDPYFKPDPRIAALEEKIKATRDFVLTWSKSKEGFSEKALRSTMHSYCTAATIAIHQMLDAGEIELISSSHGRRIYKLS